MKQTVHVSANHSHPDYCFNRHPVRLVQDRDGTWYASADKLGCSKNYATADKAARAMFADNGCFDVIIHDLRHILNR